MYGEVEERSGGGCESYTNKLHKGINKWDLQSVHNFNVTHTDFLIVNVNNSLV